MKNIVLIDIDTEREQPVLIRKPSTIVPPNTPEETKKMLTDDIACTCEALCMMIKMASDNGHGDKEDLVRTSIKYLNDVLKNEK
jgi:hypothetical protein